MVYAIFICDKQWKITKIKQCGKEFEISEGDQLTDIVLEKELFDKCEEDTYSLELTSRKSHITLPAIIHPYKEANLVIIADVNNNRDFMEFEKIQSQCLSWAKDHIYGLFHDEYFMIQRMNNLVIDSQRKLMRSNRKLETALKENHEINRQLDEARRIAEQANSAKSHFLSNMSHDIRTPLNAIVGLTELMQHNLDKPDILEGYLDKLISSSKYLLDLINDILDLSKMESDSIELKYEPIDIEAQIEQINFILRPKIIEKNIKFSVEGKDIANGYYYGDTVRFRQVIMNIVSNAIKYTPNEGKIHLSIDKEQIDEKTEMFHFVIEDSGIGMSQTFLKHIFEPFSRAEVSVKEIQGTGLGMAITKNIIDAWGGSVQVSSKLGEGSRFEVKLPFEICTENMVSAADKAQYEKNDNSEVKLEGKHFLCAEDNELNSEILTELLKMEGAECTICENGKLLVEAFENIKDVQYDAILTDIQMPVMDGYEAAERIRSSNNPLGKTIPIIAMTANAFSDDVQKCLDAGMTAHIAKPLNVQRLKEILTN